MLGGCLEDNFVWGTKDIYNVPTELGIQQLYPYSFWNIVNATDGGWASTFPGSESLVEGTILIVHPGNPENNSNIAWNIVRFPNEEGVVKPIEYTIEVVETGLCASYGLSGCLHRVCRPVKPP